MLLWLQHGTGTTLADDQPDLRWLDDQPNLRWLPVAPSRLAADCPCLSSMSF